MSVEIESPKNGGDCPLSEELYEKVKEQFRAELESVVGMMKTQDTIDNLKQRLTTILTRADCDHTYAINPRFPKYNPDPDLHKQLSYEEYVVTKNMKRQKPISESEFEDCHDAQPGSMCIDVRMRPIPFQTINLQLKVDKQ